MAREWYSRPINSGYTVVDGTTTGNYNNGVPNTYVKTWMEYKVISQDLVNNTTTIDAKLYSQVIDGGSSSGMSNTFTANNYGYVGYDNANKQYLSTTYDFNSYSLNKFADSNITIPHNADGTKTITLQGSFSTLSGTWAITGGSASASVTLPTIARKTQISSVTGLNYGYPTTIVLNRQASNLRELVTLTNGGTTLTLKDTSSADTTFAYTLDRIYTPNTAKPSPSTWTLTVTTYNGGTSIGSVTQSLTFTIRNDDTSYKPILTAQPTAAAYNDIVPALGNDTLVIGYSKMQISANKANITTKYGATVADRYVRIGGRYDIHGLDNSVYTSNLIEQSGDTIWSYVVYDSRGFQAEVPTGSLPYYTISAPTITITECYRGLSNQVADESGTYIWVTASVNYSSANGKNSCTLKAQATGFSQVTLTPNTRTAIATSASAQNSYPVTFTATDLFNTSTLSRQIPSEDVPINIREGGKGVGIGAYCEGEGLISVGYPFSGAIKSKGNRIFGTCNKLDKALIKQGALDGSTGAEVDWSARIRSEFTPIEPNTTYTVSWAGNAIPCMFYYSSAKAYVSCELTATEVTSYTFTTPSGVGFVRFTWGKYGNANITPSDISNGQLESGSYASPPVPYAMDNVELTDAVRPQVIESVLLANTSATLDYTGVYITLPSGWWAIDAYAVYNNAVPIKIALYQYQNGFSNLIAFTEAQNGLYSQYMHASCILNNGQTNDIRVYAQYSSATSNEIRIRARKLV